MSSESLSQNEIDLLFRGDEAPAEAILPTVAQEVQIYDFRRPHRVSKDRRRSLMAMYGLLTKSLESWIAGRVRDQLEFELQSVEQLTFGEFTLALPSQCASFVVSVPGTGQQGVIDFGYDFGYFIIDRFLGGSDEHVVLDRPFTPIERLVVRIVAERVAHLLSDVWKDHVQLDLEVDGFESIPEMLQVANREDPVLVANIGVTMESGDSLLLLCLPFATLETFFTGKQNRPYEATQVTTEERTSDRASVEKAILSARLPVGARLPTFQLPMGTIASIQPGQVLQTGLSPESDLELYVGGQQRFSGTPGRIGRSLAVQVDEIIVPEPENLIGSERIARG